ncbi:hypothetical protein LUZ62_025395 [Rhynchospora pubera]|uniref:Uncharacterized protein n=1 Tax=Rhynchospora pubera TaxID=906938 RepID=A0AAV8H826_9POAL|nr:hypothetical protein LUZ62_025395 [Rhynchospora pubera]
MAEVEMSMHTAKSDHLLIDIQRRLTAFQEYTNADPPQYSIYRIPSHIRKNNEYYYEPRMVSIGPYHRNKEHLRAMEVHKLRYLGKLCNQKDGILRDFIGEIRNAEADIRACYCESVDLKEGDQFVEMMLVDGCFIIKLFFNWLFNEPDAACDAGWALPLLISDLLMLENQIPFFVLTKIYNIYTFGCVDPPSDAHGDYRPSFLTLAADILHETCKTNVERAKVPEAGVTIKHLLHLFYLLFVPAPEYALTPRQINVKIKGKESRTNCLPLLQKRNRREFPGSSKFSEKNESPRVIKSAIELKEYGVILKKKEKFASFLDISFERGILEVPRITIEGCSRSRLLNLIAFEQCSGGADVDPIKKPLSSYAVFMACLMNMSQDVIVLEKAGILENNLANSEEGAKFFHQVRECAHIDFDNHYLKQVFVEVVEYCEAFWPKHRARLRHDYFSSPWTISSLMVAMLVLIMAIFHTIGFILTTFLKKY